MTTGWKHKIIEDNDNMKQWERRGIIISTIEFLNIFAFFPSGNVMLMMRASNR